MASTGTEEDYHRISVGRINRVDRPGGATVPDCRCGLELTRRPTPYGPASLSLPRHSMNTLRAGRRRTITRGVAWRLRITGLWLGPDDVRELMKSCDRTYLTRPVGSFPARSELVRCRGSGGERMGVVRGLVWELFLHARHRPLRSGDGNCPRAARRCVGRLRWVLLPLRVSLLLPSERRGERRHGIPLRFEFARTMMAA